MKGYTIQNSIDLLEKNGGGSGASSAADISFDNTGTGLVATNVQTAISEVNSNVNGLSSRFDYSTTEKVVGKWVDNSVIYESTVHIDALPAAASTGTDYPHGIANIDKIVGITGVILFPGGNVAPIPHVISKADAVTSQIGLVANATNIVINVGADRSGCDAYVTLQYTKTAPVTNTRNKKSKKED